MKDEHTEEMWNYGCEDGWVIRCQEQTALIPFDPIKDLNQKRWGSESLTSKDIKPKTCPETLNNSQTKEIGVHQISCIIIKAWEPSIENYIWSILGKAN